MKKRLYVIIYFAVFWVIIPGALILISTVLDRIVFHGTKLNSGWILPGMFLSISCFIILLITIYQFRSYSGEFPVSATPPVKIIQSGIFAVWRHPVYLFASLTFAGIAMIIRSGSLIFIVFPLFMIPVSLYTLREENILIKRFGNQYINYRKNVPLLIPDLHQWLRIPGSVFLKTWFRLTVNNRENLPASLPFIVISGHRHYFDPLFVSYAIPVPLKHVSTYEMFRNPFFHKAFTLLGVIPRKRFTADTAGTLRIFSVIRSGFPVCIFPEGGRSWTGRLRPFKHESIKLLKHLRNIPVVPVRIEGNYHSWPRWANHLMRSYVTVTIEKPVLIDPDIPDEVLEILLRNTVEPRNEAEEKTLCRGKNRIKNLSKVIYRCPVCLSSETPVEIPPEKLHCKICNTMFTLQPDFKVEFNTGGVRRFESIYNLYEHIKIRYSDIYNLLHEVSADTCTAHLETREILIYASPCQLWTGMGTRLKKSLAGVCLLTERSVRITDKTKDFIIPLLEISAVTIESNYKLQIFNERSKMLTQITFENDSALKWQDILVVLLSERYGKKIITR